MKIIGLTLALSLGFTIGGFNSAVFAADQSSTSVVSSEGTLRNVRDLAHRLMHSALYIINDVEQRDMVVTGEPMLIQPQDVYRNDKRSIGWAQEAFDLGPAEQPRKKWIDSDMGHLKQLIDLLKEDMQTTPKDDQQKEVDSAWSNANAIANEIEARYDKLVDLTKGPKYDNDAIGKEALGIYDASKRLEKPWTEVLHAVKN